MHKVEGVLDTKNPQVLDALGEYKDKVNITCVTDGREADNLIPRLEQATSVYPGAVGRIRERQVLRYLASTISSKDDESKGGTGIFFQPGAFGTSPGNAHTVAALYREASYSGEPVRLAAALSSSFSRDTTNHPLISQTEVRAANQAVLMADLIKEHECGRVLMLGHSNGGLEGMYALPALKQLIKEDGLSTRIDGLILVQSGGLFRQHPLDFFRRFLAKPLVDEAARFVYPDELATTSMEELRKRVIKTLTGADLRGEGIPTKSNLQTMILGLEDLKPVSDNIREKVDAPVAMMWGEIDNFFPAKLAQDRITEWTQKNGPFFPNSPYTKTMIVPNWPHLGLVVNTGHFSRLAVDLMQDFNYKPGM